MHYFPVDRPIWVHRRAEGKSGFWWPGEVSFANSGSISPLAVELTPNGTGQIETSIFARPLSVKLYLDTDETIKNFTCVSRLVEYVETAAHSYANAQGRALEDREAGLRDACDVP